MDEFAAIEDRFATYAKRLIDDPAARYEALRNCQFFAPVADEGLQRIAGLARIQVFNSDVCLTSQDEEAKAFYVILMGGAEAFHNGKRVGTIDTGECFGEGIFFADGHVASSATVIADYRIIAAEFDKAAVEQLRADAALMVSMDKALLLALFRKLQRANRRIGELVLLQERGG